MDTSFQDLQGVPLNSAGVESQIDENQGPSWIPSTRTGVVAILNVTPDSFSNSEETPQGLDDQLHWVEEALEHGVDLIDIGGESTRPGAEPVDGDEERRRVMPVVEGIVRRFPEARLSIDTRKAIVARDAVEAGVHVVNDVSGLQFDPAMAGVVAATGTELILMHSQGTPETMQQDPQYPRGVIQGISLFFQQQLIRCWQQGIESHKIILDPGIGFGKTVDQNMELFSNLRAFQALGHPVLVGSSRKSCLTLGDASILPDQREPLTAASIAVAISQGVQLVRIHDLKAQLPVIHLLDRIYHR